MRSKRRRRRTVSKEVIVIDVSDSEDVKVTSNSSDQTVEPPEGDSVTEPVTSIIPSCDPAQLQHGVNPVTRDTIEDNDNRSTGDKRLLTEYTTDGAENACERETTTSTESTAATTTVSTNGVLTTTSQMDDVISDDVRRTAAGNETAGIPNSRETTFQKLRERIMMNKLQKSQSCAENGRPTRSHTYRRYSKRRQQQSTVGPSSENINPNQISHPVKGKCLTGTEKELCRTNVKPCDKDQDCIHIMTQQLQEKNQQSCTPSDDYQRYYLQLSNVLYPYGPPQIPIKQEVQVKPDVLEPQSLENHMKDFHSSSSRGDSKQGETMLNDNILSKPCTRRSPEKELINTTFIDKKMSDEESQWLRAIKEEGMKEVKRSESSATAVIVNSNQQYQLEYYKFIQQKKKSLLQRSEAENIVAAQSEQIKQSANKEKEAKTPALENTAKEAFELTDFCSSLMARHPLYLQPCEEGQNSAAGKLGMASKTIHAGEGQGSLMPNPINALLGKVGFLPKGDSLTAAGSMLLSYQQGQGQNHSQGQCQPRDNSKTEQSALSVQAHTPEGAQIMLPYGSIMCGQPLQPYLPINSQSLPYYAPMQSTTSLDSKSAEVIKPTETYKTVAKQVDGTDTHQEHENIHTSRRKQNAPRRRKPKTTGKATEEIQETERTIMPNMCSTPAVPRGVMAIPNGTVPGTLLGIQPGATLPNVPPGIQTAIAPPALPGAVPSTTTGESLESVPGGAIPGKNIMYAYIAIPVATMVADKKCDNEKKEDAAGSPRKTSASGLTDVQNKTATVPWIQGHSAGQKPVQPVQPLSVREPVFGTGVKKPVEELTTQQPDITSSHRVQTSIHSSQRCSQVPYLAGSMQRNHNINNSTLRHNVRPDEAPPPDKRLKTDFSTLNYHGLGSGKVYSCDVNNHVDNQRAVNHALSSAKLSRDMIRQEQQKQQDQGSRSHAQMSHLIYDDCSNFVPVSLPKEDVRSRRISAFIDLTDDVEDIYSPEDREVQAIDQRRQEILKQNKKQDIKEKITGQEMLPLDQRRQKVLELQKQEGEVLHKRTHAQKPDSMSHREQELPVQLKKGVQELPTQPQKRQEEEAVAQTIQEEQYKLMDNVSKLTELHNEVGALLNESTHILDTLTPSSGNEQNNPSVETKKTKGRRGKHGRKIIKYDAQGRRIFKFHEYCPR